MAMKRRKDWTEESLYSFQYRLIHDFIGNAEARMRALGMKPSKLAELLGVSQERVSQLLNVPGNLTLKTAIRIARALRMKVTLLPYDDGDEQNFDGLIHADVFRICWEKCGKPRDMFDLEGK